MVWTDDHTVASSQLKPVRFHQKDRLSQATRTMWPYLPSKSALAPTQQLHNNINFIHKCIICRVTRPRCSSYSTIAERKQLRWETVPVTRAERCTGSSLLACPTAHLWSSKATKPVRCLGVERPPMCVRVRREGRTLPGGERTAPCLTSSAPTAARPYLASRITSDLSKTDVEPAAPWT